MQAIAQLRGAGYTREQALALINRMIDQQAFTMAANDLFWLSSLIFVALVALAWATRRRQGPLSAIEGGAH